MSSETADTPIAIKDLHKAFDRSEEHTSELQSQSNLVCRLLLEKKKVDEYLRGVRMRRALNDREQRRLRAQATGIEADLGDGDGAQAVLVPPRPAAHPVELAALD